ncbi:MAG TPA: hypothetical protein VK979_08505, partial [Guyparkeria sp.]|nr:hypothetical protein [Guyparkeria sp.]
SSVTRAPSSPLTGGALINPPVRYRVRVLFIGHPIMGVAGAKACPFAGFVTSWPDRHPGSLLAYGAGFQRIDGPAATLGFACRGLTPALQATCQLVVMFLF